MGVVVVILVELIDTQWDVNNSEYENDYISLGELIDTQWDVNKGLEKKYIEHTLRINRYIVGCKYANDW